MNIMENIKNTLNLVQASLDDKQGYYIDVLCM